MSSEQPPPPPPTPPPPPFLRSIRVRTGSSRFLASRCGSFGITIPDDKEGNPSSQQSVVFELSSSPFLKNIERVVVPFPRTSFFDLWRFPSPSSSAEWRLSPLFASRVRSRKHSFFAERRGLSPVSFSPCFVPRPVYSRHMSNVLISPLPRVTMIPFQRAQVRGCVSFSRVLSAAIFCARQNREWPPPFFRRRRSRLFLSPHPSPEPPPPLSRTEGSRMRGRCFVPQRIELFFPLLTRSCGAFTEPLPLTYLWQKVVMIFAKVWPFRSR